MRPLRSTCGCSKANRPRRARRKRAAEKLWQEGTALFNQGSPSDALSKFKESLGYCSDATRTKYVSDLEARRAKATALRDEGAKLQQGNRIPEAMRKYNESLTYWPDPRLNQPHRHPRSESRNRTRTTDARKARAKQLRDEGYALQQKNQIQAAVGKYKESLAILPDKQLEDYIRQLEAKTAAKPTAVPQTTSTPAVTARRRVPGPGPGAVKTGPRTLRTLPSTRAATVLREPTPSTRR